MASYIELQQLFNAGWLHNKVDTALVIAAHGLLNKDTPTAEEVSWAAKIFSDRKEDRKRVVLYILAEHKELSKEEIQDATDVQVQAAVDVVVPKLIQAG